MKSYKKEDAVGESGDESVTDVTARVAAATVDEAEAAERGAAEESRESRVGLDPGTGDADEGDADPSAAAASETRGQVGQRHKREAKAVKDQVKRLGKKNKDEGVRLERELAERHAAELEALEARERDEAGEGDGHEAAGPEAVADPVAAAVASVVADAAPAGGRPRGQPSKAARRRAEKLAEARARDERVAAEREAQGVTEGERELGAVDAALAARGLRRLEVQPDGHCLYRALSVALDDARGVPGAGLRGGLPDAADTATPAAGTAHTYASLRKMAALSLRSDEAAYAPFVEAPSFAAYCDEVESTAAWGGELELRALARGLGVEILVHQGGDEPLKISPEGQPRETVNVVYLRHAYGLGEHYDAATRVPEAEAGVAAPGPPAATDDPEDKIPAGVGEPGAGGGSDEDEE